MKMPAVLVLSLGMLMHGGAFAASPKEADESATRQTVAYDLGTQSDSKIAAVSPVAKDCNGSGEGCKTAEPVWGCGAFASHQKDFGFGFAATANAAASKALESCGQNDCKVVSSGCQD